MDIKNVLELRVLILGKGGREHAFAWKLSKEARVTKIVVAPGNAGITTREKISATLRSVPIEPKDNFKTLIEWAKFMKFNLVIPGDQRFNFAGLGELFTKGKQDFI